MSSAFLARIEKPSMFVAGKLGQQPHLNAIRDGVVGALPLILIGSLFMLITNPPLASQAALVSYKAQPFVQQMLVFPRLLLGLVAVFVAFGVAHSLAKRYNLDALSAGLIAVAALFLVNGYQNIAVGGAANQLFIPALNLSSNGLFVGLLLGLLTPEMQRLAHKFHLEIRMPDGVPPAVGRSFSALIPGLLVLLPLWVLVYVLHIDLFGLITHWLTGPIQQLSGTVDTRHSGASMLIVYSVLLVIILIDSFLWLLGVHAVAILAPMSAIWLMNITANAQAGAAAHLLNTRETLTFFIWLGGSGATIVLPFLLLRARSVALRAIAKVGLLPALFNINEPLIFGIPIMMNPLLIIPFIMAPVVALTTTVLAVQYHLVPVPSLVVPWTLPGPLGAYLTTGNSWAAVGLSCTNIALAALIYWPFVRALDNKMTLEEQAATPVPNGESPNFHHQRT